MKLKAATPIQFSFKTKLVNWAEGMDYCAVAVPAKITKALRTKGPVLVMGQLNKSEPFKVSLFPVGGGKHFVRIKSQIRKETKTKTGDLVRFSFTVLDRSDIVYPLDLLSALKAEGVTADFKAIPDAKKENSSGGRVCTSQKREAECLNFS
jgi:hypothetical protein